MKLIGLVILVFIGRIAYGQTDTLKRKQLQTVTIRSVRPKLIARPDGFVYNTRNEPHLAGEKAGDLLRKLPGVMVSPEGEPAINGSTRVRIFIDGKPSEVFAATAGDALKLIPVENIASVTVITHPSAKYEGEGVDAVIEIITKKPTSNAISGDLTTTLANRINEFRGELLIRQNKLIVGLDASYDNFDPYVLSQTRRQGAGTELTQEKLAIMTRNSANGGISLNYLADTLRTLSAGYRLNWYQEQKTILLDNRLVTGNTTDEFMRNSHNPFRRQGFNGNLGYLQRSRDKRSEFSLLLTGFNQPISGGYELTESNYHETNQNTGSTKNLTLQSDYSHRDSKNGKLEFGGRYNIGRSFNDNNYIPDIGRSGSFGLNSTIAAVYGSYGFDVKGWQFRGGLRYEYTHFMLNSQNGELAAPRYNTLLPNLLISRTFGNMHTFSLGYTKKLQRPFQVYLNPTVNYLDSLNIEYGNPNLQPVIMHNYLFSYTYQYSRVTLAASAFINHSLHNIEYVRMIRPGGGSAATWVNISSNTQYGTTFNLSYQGSHLTASLNNTLRSVHFNTDGTLPAKDGLQFSSAGYFSWKFNDGYTLGSFANFNTRNLSLQGYSTSSVWYYITLGKNFANDRLSLAARIENLFAHYQYTTEEIMTPTFSQQIRTRNMNRFFKLSIAWKIGKKELKLPVAPIQGNEN